MQIGDTVGDIGSDVAVVGDVIKVRVGGKQPTVNQLLKLLAVSGRSGVLLKRVALDGVQDFIIKNSVSTPNHALLIQLVVEAKAGRNVVKVASIAAANR